MNGTKERFDVLDDRGRKTGALVERDEAHAKGIWHGAFHCLIIYRGEGRPKALFQLRSLHKKIAAGLFDVSVGGHYAAGEGPMEAGPREVREELGLAIRFEDLLPLGRRTSFYDFEAGIREFEFQDVFLLPMERRPAGLVPGPGEVDALLELDIPDGTRLFTGEAGSIDAVLLRPGGEADTVAVTAERFVRSHDRYHARLLAVAERWFGGEREDLAF